MRAAHPNRSSRPRWALLLIDWINDFAFEGSRSLIEAARPAAAVAADLKRRARTAGVPCIYVNDNFGRWRSSFKDTIQQCRERSEGREVFARLLPDDEDYFVLKPRHSGFFLTPLELLLDQLDVGTLVLTGLAGNICVLFTAHDAHMREFKVVVARDAVASNERHDNDWALRQLEQVVHADVRPGAEIEFPASAP